MNHRTYVVIPAATVESVDFEKVMETSEDTLRWSVDGTKTFVKYEGERPDFLEGLTSYNHDEIRALLATSEWSDPDPE
jgi:hypothetical protein